MPRDRSNKYPLRPTSPRVMQDIVDRMNYSTDEIQSLKEAIPEAIAPFASKENPQPGMVTIPGSVQDGAIRVNKEGVIVSYVNPVGGFTENLSPITIDTFQTEIRNSATSEVTLFSTTIPNTSPYMFSRFGDSANFYVCGFSLGTAGTKVFRVKVNGTTILTFAFTVINQNLELRGEIFRMDNNNVVAGGTLSLSDTSVRVDRGGGFTVDWASPVAILITIEDTGAINNTGAQFYRLLKTVGNNI